MSPLRILCRLVLGLLLTAPLAAADGDLDTTFDGDGIWRSLDAGTFSFTRSIGAPDGATVLFSARLQGASRAYAWTRVSDAGAGSICSYTLAGYNFTRPPAAAFDHAGKLVLAGVVRVASGDDGLVAVLRYNYPACTLDTTLNSTGFVTHAVPVAGHTRVELGGVVAPRWIEVINQLPFERKRILIAVSLEEASGPSDGYLLRLRDDGALDTGFGGGDGISFVLEDLLPAAFASAGDSHFLVAGIEDASGGIKDPVVVKVDRDGALQGGFGVGGVARINGPGAFAVVAAMAVSSDKRIAVVGNDGASNALATVAVLLPSGALDTSFSGDGQLTFLANESTLTKFRGAHFQGDGKLLVAGNRDDPNDSSDDEALAARFLRSGALDSTFGPGGFEVLALDLIAAGEDLGTGISLNVDGRIWLGGSTATDSGGGTEYKPFVAKLENSYVFADGFERGTTALWSTAVQ